MKGLKQDVAVFSLSDKDREILEKVIIALKFYAEEKVYRGDPLIMQDRGELARKSLRELPILLTSLHNIIDNKQKS